MVRVRAFLKRAGTTIFAIMILIWFLSSVPAPKGNATIATCVVRAGLDVRAIAVGE